VGVNWRWPLVSRTAFDIVTAQVVSLLEEKKALILKCENLERAMLKASQQPPAVEYMRRVEPREPGPIDPEPLEPPIGSSWEAMSAYLVEHEEWKERRKKVS
jgi:hypothetical protein